MNYSVRLHFFEALYLLLVTLIIKLRNNVDEMIEEIHLKCDVTDQSKTFSRKRTLKRLKVDFLLLKSELIWFPPCSKANPSPTVKTQ